MSHFHAVVWMDHAEAHVLHFTPDEVEGKHVAAPSGAKHLHHRRGSIGSGKKPEDHAYFDKVAEALTGAEQILLTGPANEKHEFRKYLDTHAKALAGRVVAVQTSDHPSDGELLKQARQYFVAADRMHTRR